MNDRPILVTGADGFIGSHVVEALVRGGREVRALAWYNARGAYGWLEDLEPDVASQVEVRLGDITDRTFVERCMDDVEGVINLAALIGIPYSFVAPDSYVRTNIEGTLNILEAARRTGVGKIVQLSTSEVYGNAEVFPIPETARLHPQSPYAATKVASDQLALSYQRAFNLPVAVARPFNTFGPRQSARAVIPTIIAQLLSASGVDCVLRLGELDVQREFCFVKDTADGILAIYDSPASIGEVINIGSGFEISVRQLVELGAEITGKRVVVEIDPGRIRPGASEINRLLSDGSKARQLLNWSARYTGMQGFEEGLREFATWLSEPRRLAIYKPGAYNI